MQHKVGSSLSYHTHTLHPPKSLSGGRVPSRNKRVPGTGNKGREGAHLRRERTFQDDGCFFLSLGIGKPVFDKLVSIWFGCLARTCHACSVEDVSVFQGTHHCLKCKCPLAACCQRVAHGTSGRLAYDAPTFGAGSPAGTTTISVFA